MNIEQWSKNRFATLALVRTIFSFIKIVLASIVIGVVI
jgi:hypothetical protein